MSTRDHLSATVPVALEEALKQSIAKDSIRPIGEPSDDDLAIINSRHSRRPLTKGDVYVFENEISNNLIDSYFTQMDVKTTLANYVRDFNAGLPLMTGHDTPKKLPLGRSFAAELATRGQTNNPDDPFRRAVVAKTYIPRGIRIGDQSSDDLIAGIDAGILKDVSVQFRDASYQCSICGNEMNSRDCSHTPGRADAATKKVATATLRNARALEHSLVFKGSTPMATVAKTRSFADEAEGIFLLRDYGICSPEEAEEACVRAAGVLVRGACPKCGGTIDPQMDTCPSCGFQPGAIAPPEPAKRPSKPEKPTSPQMALDQAGVERDTVVTGKESSYLQEGSPTPGCLVCGAPTRWRCKCAGGRQRLQRALCPSCKTDAGAATICPRCGKQLEPARFDIYVALDHLINSKEPKMGSAILNGYVRPIQEALASTLGDVQSLEGELARAYAAAVTHERGLVGPGGQTPLATGSEKQVTEVMWQMASAAEALQNAVAALGILIKGQASTAANLPPVHPLSAFAKNTPLEDGFKGASHKFLGQDPEDAGIVQAKYGPSPDQQFGKVGRSVLGAHQFRDEQERAMRAAGMRGRKGPQKIKALPV